MRVQDKESNIRWTSRIPISGPSTRSKGQDKDSTRNSVRATDDDKSGLGQSALCPDKMRFKLVFESHRLAHST